MMEIILENKLKTYMCFPTGSKDDYTKCRRKINYFFLSLIIKEVLVFRPKPVHKMMNTYEKDRKAPVFVSSRLDY